jgi:hypothetical protein
MANDLQKPTQSEILIYQTEEGRTRIQVRLEDETVWLPQKLMAELFQKDVRTVNEHIRNIYEEGELTTEGTIRKFRMVQSEGFRQVSREVDFHKLDVIPSTFSSILPSFRLLIGSRNRKVVDRGVGKS